MSALCGACVRSNFQFGCPNSLLFMHCSLAVVLVKVCEAAGLLSKPLEPLRPPIVRIWMPGEGELGVTVF